jgi:hypothetical protein
MWRAIPRKGEVIEGNTADDALMADQDRPQRGCNDFLEE